jgi:hypothetical protein
LPSLVVCEQRLVEAEEFLIAQRHASSPPADDRLVLTLPPLLTPRVAPT